MTLTRLETEFNSRETMLAYLARFTPHTEQHASETPGGRSAALALLTNIDPVNYGKTRNHLNGHVSKLSPYIRHGILSLNEVRNEALKRCSHAQQVEKFIQELAWRDFWQRVYRQNPHWITHDVEAYKTGFTPDDYADKLPEDILNANTDCACINQFIHTLTHTGWLHNHARMYLAAYVVHWRRVKWQAGAEWFLHHLLDGNPASNNLSWQWIASTFSNKPYIFNLENVQKYSGADIDTSPENNRPLNASYEQLHARLFPHKSDAP